MQVHSKKSVQVDSENLPKLLTVLDLVANFKGKKIHKNKDAYSSHVYRNFHSVAKSIGRHCMDLIINSISNHRYEETAKILWILNQDRAVFGPFIFKVGVIVLSNLEFNNKNDIILNFFCSIVDYIGISRKEALIEFIIYTLKNDITNIKSSVKEFHQRKMSNRLLIPEVVDSFYEAHTALLDYIEWCKIPNGVAVIPQSQNQVYQDKTVDSLKKLLNSPGSCDVFVLKLLKVMITCDMKEEIQNSLIEYVEKNPENINAYIYLCTFLYHYIPESEKLLSYLEVLAEKSPSDVRVLWLIEILNKSENNLIRSLSYIFMFLDYPVNGKNVLAWKILWQMLSKVDKSKDKNQLKAVNSLWKYRSPSWKWMYSNPSIDSRLNFTDESLILNKVAALSFLLDGSKYIKKMSKIFPGIQEKVNCMLAAEI